jgi:hypothetical protein
LAAFPTNPRPLTGTLNTSELNVAPKPVITLWADWHRYVRLIVIEHHRPKSKHSSVAKLKEVSRLLDQLSLDLKEDKLSPSRKFTFRKKTSEDGLLTGIERDQSLEQLKVFGRDPAYADPIFAKEVGLAARPLAGYRANCS